MIPNTIQVVVTGVIENARGEVLLIKRNKKSIPPNCWEDPGGKLEQSEKPEEGLLREIAEETGIKEITIIKPLTVFHDYLEGEKKKEKEFVGIAYWCKTTTKKVKLTTEHSDYQWVTPEQAIDIVNHPAVKEYLKIMIQEKQLEKKIDLLTYEKERRKND
ncbi:MAG: NUDIX domain-containing protein [Candidatus Heimdallarchaeota archaeon]|nr:NUDIX domain-containing protein [Candidatus Heimdallarchaeota archaeon]